MPSASALPRGLASRALCAAALLRLVGTVAAWCGAGGSACLDGDLEDTAMLQRDVKKAGGAALQQGVAEAPEAASQRIMARITELPTFRLVEERRKTETVLRSVVPVFPPGGGAFIAFVGDYNQNTWPLLRPNGTASGLECVAKDGSGHRSPVEAFGAEQRKKQLWTTVYKCAWPDELRSKPCHSGSLVYRGATVFDFEACHDPALASEGQYDLAACIEPLFESPEKLTSSGIVQLPQWLEYNMQKGVQHFVVYTMNNTDPRVFAAMKPFLDAKLMTQVRLEVPFHATHGGQKTQMLVINDCVQRMRGRAKWLMTSVDTDEYTIFNTSKGPLAETFQDSLAKLIADQPETIHAVSFPRINFLRPKQPYDQLQIASASRETGHCGCPKYFVRPDMVNSLFVHFPQSWDNGTRHLGVHEQAFVAFHYRLDAVNKSVVDTTLSSQAPALDAALGRRYGKGWADIGRTFAPAAQPAAFIASPSGRDEDQLDEEYEAQDAGLRRFTEYVAGLKVPTLIDGELDSLFGS